ncbi:MAG: CBS domain-containing protein [Pseudomonadota bacterium]|nr:CBS domain-containing protein [Pseudomonadota bacterium]
MVAADRNPPTTPLAAVMTSDPDCVTPDATLAEPWARMSRGGYCHLPVVADGSAVGIVSVRDLHAAVMAGLQADLKERDAFTAGIGPGGLN